MIIKVIFDDNTDDMIYSHVLQLGIEFGLDGKKIKMFYRESENAWIITDSDIVRRRSQKTGPYSGPERRYEAPLASYHFIKPDAGRETKPESPRRVPQFTGA